MLKVDSWISSRLDDKVHEAINEVMTEMEIRSVLHEIVYDIETWDARVNQLTLAHEVLVAQSKLKDQEQKTIRAEKEKEKVRWRIHEP